MMAEGADDAEGDLRHAPSKPELEHGNEAVYDFYCLQCQEEEKHVEATWYCGACEEYMCDNCGGYHKKSRLSRHHVLLDADNMPRDTPLEEKADKTIATMCEKHPTELVRYVL